MIYGNIKDIDRYKFLKAEILSCFDYLKNNKLIDYSSGSYKIDGDNIFVNINEYETTTESKRFWEAHKKYIDLHIMLDGLEQINLNFISNMNIGEYNEETDFLQMSGEDLASVRLSQGDFLICYPEDAHMTALKINNSEPVKKAIFKIKL